jgi:aminoglycoside phosphotransferase (APT) family kinase protein
MIKAVLDWELATLGDPLADVGWLLASWMEDTEVVGTPAGDLSASVLPGFPSRAELIDRYQVTSGTDLSGIDFYVAFATWRHACISSGVLARYEAGVMGDDGYDTSRLRRTIVAGAEAAVAMLESR